MGLNHEDTKARSKYKPYPSYKDSGVEWLGEIPEHWLKSAIKFMAIGKDTLFIDGDWIESKDISDSGIKYITTGNVGVGIYKEQGSGFISDETFKKLNCTELFAGDLLVSRLNAPIGRACIVPELNNRVVTSVDNVVIRPNIDFSKQFLKYLFTSSEYFQHTSNLARGSTMQRISRGLLGNVRFSYPSLDEQKSITSFLDQETGKIDLLIEKQQAMIALLKEKRQAVISHAVTKGLNPNTPLKDSGIKWLGQIPEDWVVKRLKFNYKLQSKKVEITNQQVIALENIEGWTGRLVSTDSAYQGQDVEFLDGDILFGKLRPYLAKVYRCKSLGVGFGDILVYRPKSHMDSDFSFYQFLNEQFISIVDSSTYGTKMPRASSEFIGEMYLPTPPKPEQKEIASYLDTQTQKIDTLIEKSQQAITLLKERKTALISAAVTGKIDVREHINV